MRWLPLLLVTACSPSTTQIQACDAAAIARATHRALVQCRDEGYGWETCPARQLILEDLREELARCGD